MPSSAARTMAATAPSPRIMGTSKRGFTLLEVMIALAVLGISMLALLSLHHQNLLNVIRSEQTSQAALLAQGLMTKAELQRLPPIGTTRGNFNQEYPGDYPNFRWERKVAPSNIYPDLVKVTIRIIYGPGFKNTFTLAELFHNPAPQQSRATMQPQEPAGQSSGNLSDQAVPGD